MKLADAPTTQAVGAPPPRRERHHRLELVAFPVLAYVPFLVSSPGASPPTRSSTSTSIRAGCSRACPYLWDSHIGSAPSPTRSSATCSRWARSSGSPTTSGCPSWVAQRLWLGIDLARRRPRCPVAVPHAGVARAGRSPRALVYMLTPYQLAVHRPDLRAAPGVGRVAVVGRPGDAGGRRGGWRDPALLRAGRSDHRRRQRELAGPRGHRSRPVAPRRRVVVRAGAAVPVVRAPRASRC